MHQDKLDAEKLRQRSKLTALDLYTPQTEKEYVLFSDAHTKRPVVGQESRYGGYEKLKAPFTASDEYNFMDAFFGGLKLEDFFEYSDECINAFVWLVDDAYYLENNITLVDNNKTENGWHIYLNVTYMIGGKGSEILPQCYLFVNSVYLRESDRWERFERDWGQFFLSLLFNLMGNALNFQQRITNIK